MKRWLLPWFAIAAAVLLSFIGPAQPCSDHEDPAVGRDLLAESYPGALHILAVIAEARKERLLPPANPMAALWVDRFPLQRHIRAVQKFEDVLNRTAGDAVQLSFSMVMIEPMIWTRFAVTGTQARSVIHTQGAEAGELVVISAEDVIIAIGDGRWTIRAAYDAGLLTLHGKPADVERFRALYGGDPNSHHADLTRP